MDLDLILAGIALASWLGLAAIINSKVRNAPR